MYQFTPDEIDGRRAHHQAVKQDADDVEQKRIGNLGELAFEQFCREYLPAEMWEWVNEAAIRRCNPESYAGHDFEVFGFEIDVKTSRDVSAFLPETLVENDSDDDIVVMAWHRDNEDGLVLLGWERVETLTSKVESQEEFSGEEPEKLQHLAMRPMNDLADLGPNTAHLNQTPDNPFRPGDRVTLDCRRRGDSVEFRVHNPAYIPHDEQIQIFRRTFSTKGRDRGLGTYSIRLLSEYLEGDVSYTSSKEAGTTFVATYPVSFF